MGKPSTGSYCTIEVRRLDLRYLQKAGYVVRGARTEGALNWTSRGEDVGSVTIQTTYTDSKSFIRLAYSIGGQEYDYTISLHRVASNLGKGEQLYLVCPRTGKFAKVLYMAYGSNMFLSREAYKVFYKKPIYYELQVCSKRDRYNTRYWNIQRRLDEGNKLRLAKDYAGKRTRRAERIQRLHDRQEIADKMRWSPAAMTRTLAREIFKDGQSDWPIF